MLIELLSPKCKSLNLDPNVKYHTIVLDEIDAVSSMGCSNNILVASNLSGQPQLELTISLQVLKL